MTWLPVNFQPKQVRAIVYCDYTGRMQATVAAALHLGTELKGSSGDLPAGTLILQGQDAKGRQIFTLGVSYENELIPKAMRGFAGLYGIPAKNLIIKDLTNLGKYSFGFGALLESISGLKKVAGVYNSMLIKRKLKRIKEVAQED